jgi:hypothetical protein
MEGYRPRSFDCETGSHFHHGHVSGGPPIIPDSRFSQVRFGVSAIFFFLGPSQPQRGLSADSHTPLLLLVCPGPSSHLPRKAYCRLCVRSPVDRRNDRVPRVPLPNVGVTSIGETWTVSSEGVTPPSSLLRTHAPIPSPLPDFGLGLARGVCAGCHQPLLLTGPSRRYSANPSSDA